MKAGERDPLKGLRDTAVSLEDAAVAEARGRQISERLAGAIREVPARRRAARRRKAVAWAGAATCALGMMLVLVGQMRRLPGASSTSAAAPQGAASGPLAERDATREIVEELAGQLDVVNAEGRTAAAVRASALEPSDEIVTRANGRGSITLRGGTRVDLSEDTRLRLQAASTVVPAQGTRLALLQGKVDVHVPHLGRGQSFAVVTPQAEVIVHGTVFSVEVVNAVGQPAETCVAVREGLVAVRSLGSELLLSPSMHWSSHANGSQCTTVRTPPSVGARSSAAAHASRGLKKAVDQDAASAASSGHVNSLAVQNRLFEAAMVARQNGDDREAIQLFDELLRRYPDSALASEAVEQRRHAQEHLHKGPSGSEP